LTSKLKGFRPKEKKKNKLDGTLRKRPPDAPKRGKEKEEKGKKGETCVYSFPNLSQGGEGRKRREKKKIQSRDVERERNSSAGKKTHRGRKPPFHFELGPGEKKKRVRESGKKKNRKEGKRGTEIIGACRSGKKFLRN